MWILEVKKNRELKLAAREELKGNWLKLILITLVYGLIIYGSNFGVYWLVDMLGSRFLDSIIFGPLGYMIWVDILMIFLIALNALLIYSFLNFFLKFSRNENPGLGELFSGFGNFCKIFLTFFLIILLMFPLVVVQIIFLAIFNRIHIMIFLFPFVGMILIQHIYVMSFFILNDYPELSVFQVLKKSRTMMQKNKGKLFLLELSFGGWGLLLIVLYLLVGIYFYPDGIYCPPDMSNSIFAFGKEGLLVVLINLLWLVPYIMLTLVKFYESLRVSNDLMIP